LVIFAAVFISITCSDEGLTNSEESALYTPGQSSDWEVSTPAQQGLNPEIVQNLYLNAERIDHLYSLVIVKNGYLIAEKYYNGMNVFDSNPSASVTKSYISALTGIALQENILTSLDQKMMEFFPEIDWQNIDSRKSQITIKQILQMRSGYPWEEFTGDITGLFSRSNWIPFIETFQLSGDPGTQFGYSNMTAHMLAIILSRAANTSLLSFAQEYLFDLIEVNPEFWPADLLGYHYGSGDIQFTPREMAKFGLLYLNNGLYNGNQIIPAEWITESLQKYSYNTYNRKILTHFDLLDYGYLWWSSTAGNHDVDFAWGHGGQLIVLVDDLNMVIVTTADHLPGQFGDAAWQKEKSILDLVGGFIANIPLN
jgi:CubicO group peptidase (beta-lactamase class C family)